MRRVRTVADEGRVKSPLIENEVHALVIIHVDILCGLLFF